MKIQDILFPKDYSFGFHPILSPHRWSPSWSSTAWGYMDWYSFKTHPTCYLLNKPSLFNFRPKAYAILPPSLNTLCLSQSFSLSHYDLLSLLPMPTRLWSIQELNNADKCLTLCRCSINSSAFSRVWKYIFGQTVYLEISGPCQIFLIVSSIN